MLRKTPLLVSSEMGPISSLRRTSSFENPLVRSPYATEFVLGARESATGGPLNRDHHQARFSHGENQARSVENTGTNAPRKHIGTYKAQ